MQSKMVNVFLTSTTLGLHNYCPITLKLSKKYVGAMRQVLRGHLRRNCDQCGGALRMTEPAAVFTDALTVFRNVATYHGFQLLQDATEWLLQMPSAAH